MSGHVSRHGPSERGLVGLGAYELLRGAGGAQACKVGRGWREAFVSQAGGFQLTGHGEPVKGFDIGVKGSRVT